MSRRGGTSSAGEVTDTQEWRVSPNSTLARCNPTSGVFAPFFPRSQITTYLALACMQNIPLAWKTCTITAINMLSPLFLRPVSFPRALH